MLSVAKLSPGQESYYERSVAQGVDDYYAGRGESPGVWAGMGAVGLGLEGVVAEGALAEIIGARDPVSGRQLRWPARAREIQVERIDPHTGISRVETKKLAPVAGYDLVFSCPKSVSLLHALGDAPTRRAVNEAHTRAWQAALSYLEDDACVVRRGKGGHVREHGEGLVAAAYQHRTSRAQDPHLHTHVIVANMARSPVDGAWRALDGHAILKTHRLAAGYLYQAQLRHELTVSLGVRWRDPVKGMAELQDVPTDVLAEFSRRRLQVLERLQQTGGRGWRSAQLAAVSTRERKEPIDLAQLREEWTQRAAGLGFRQQDLEGVLDRTPARWHTSKELGEIARRLVGPEGITERQTTFVEPELVMAWAQALTLGADSAQVRAVATKHLASDSIQRVGPAAGAGRPGSYSTRELIHAERRALAVVERGPRAEAPAVSAETVAAAIRAPGNPIVLSAEQRAMVEHTTLSSDRVVCAVGHAGAGKTAATRTIRHAYEEAGITVLGAAPSGAAAERLQDDTDIPSRTLHRVLHDAKRAGGLPHRCVLVIDEAGMAETRVLSPLLEHIEQADGKAVLVGDPAQLPAVGAGGLLTTIVERVGAAELRQNRRQHESDERKALRAIRNGSGRDYLAHAESQGRITTHGDPALLRARLLADWWQHARDNTIDNAMIALKRRDVHELNTLARLLMDAAGKLGDSRVTVANGEYAAGDRIVCRRNNDHLGVRNGTRATVTSVNTETQTIDILTDRGDQRTINHHYLANRNVEHAYALTGHKAQGSTLERAFILPGSHARLQEWGYVALSRARTNTRVYLTRPLTERDTHAQTLDQPAPIDDFARALEQARRQRLAIDHNAPTSAARGTRAELAQSR